MRFHPWPVLAVLILAADLRAADVPPRQVRVVGPDVLQRGTRHLLYAEGTTDGRTWKPLDPDHFRVRIVGPARLLDDPAGKPMNPFEVRCDDAAQGKVTVELQTPERSATKTFPLGTARLAGSFEATVSPAEAWHRFAGLGGGVLFYDNQFDITTGDDIYDWCFRDVRTSFLHVLIRPGYEKEADRGIGPLDLTKFDFRSLERPFRIVKKALERNPDLQIYASLYSPPPWMKTNGTTGGQGTLKDGPLYRRLLARYVFAYLKYAQSQGITVHYLSWFNEPDWPHTQDGMHFDDLGVLAETFHECARDLDALIAADAGLKKAPVHVFADTLGAGSITRAGIGSQKLGQRAALLNRVGVWGVHDYWNQAGPYWNNRFRELRAFPGVGSKPIWLTEWAQRSRHGDLASGAEYGAEILNALRLGAEAWMVFEWCHPSGNQAGLISTDWGAKPPRARYWRSKAYHVFRQIANHTPAGARVVAMTGRWTGRSQANGKGVEYVALRDGDRVIVHLMNTEPAPVTYRVQVRAAAEKADGWLTTPAADLVTAGTETVTLGKRGGAATLSGAVPGNSLLTVVLRATSAGYKPS